VLSTWAFGNVLARQLAIPDSCSARKFTRFHAFWWADW